MTLLNYRAGDRRRLDVLDDFVNSVFTIPAVVSAIVSAPLMLVRIYRPDFRCV